MDLNKNYYGILQVTKDSSEKEIKKSYYKLSFLHHPDKGGDGIIFAEIAESYDILSSSKKEEYDIKSKWGSKYDESTEFLDYEFSNSAKIWDENKLDNWKKNNQLNVVIHIDDNFNGNIEYERWIICKNCGGNGKDTTSKIHIKDEKGNILKTFDGCDGCDFCEGSGKDFNGNTCFFCMGKGITGLTDCKVCNGEKRILGKQKLKGIKFPESEMTHKIESMGHSSKHEVGKVGHVWLIKPTIKDS